MKKLGLIAAAAAVLALAGCNNGAQDVRITGLELGSANYYDVEGTGTYKIETKVKINDEKTSTTTKTYEYTAKEASLGVISVSPQITDTNMTKYNISISGLTSKISDGNTSTTDENDSFSFSLVELGGDYYFAGNGNGGSGSYDPDDYFPEGFALFAGNNDYVKVDIGDPEDLSGTFTYTSTYGNTTVTYTYTLDFELSKL